MHDAQLFDDAARNSLLHDQCLNRVLIGFVLTVTSEAPRGCALRDTYMPVCCADVGDTLGMVDNVPDKPTQQATAPDDLHVAAVRGESG